MSTAQSSRTPELRLWGRMTSINVRKVVLCLQELGLAFERIDAGLAFGVVNTPAYRAHNPNGLVPLLEDSVPPRLASASAERGGAFTLWESNVIMRYLCWRQGSALLPRQPHQRFDAERWMDWQQTTLNPAGRDAFVQLIRKPGGTSDERLVQASVAATEPLLDLLDAHLARQPYMAGDALTVADMPIACELHRWRGLPLPQQPRPHLDAWYARLLARPSARGVLDLSLA